MRLEVHKFGGTSVAGAERQRAVARIIAEAAAGARLVVVSSAMAGITNALCALVDSALAGERSAALDQVAAVLRQHEDCLAALAPERSSSLRAELRRLVDEVSDLVKAAVVLGELSLRTRDRILSCGEKLAVRLLACALRGEGLRALAIDADELVETDGRFGQAAPLGELAARGIRGRLAPLLDEGVIPVITGYCGRAPDGATTTLGRGGSDLSATVIAAALAADEVSIWTDVDGVYSADPRRVPEARVLRQLNYREASELSYYGAKVLHQRTMIPVVHAHIPVRLRNSFCPEAPGTIIDDGFTAGSHPVKAISSIPGHVLLSIEGQGMSGVPGMAAKIFQALAGREVNVAMISQSSSESSITLALRAEQARAATSALKQALAAELARGDVEEIVLLPEVELVAAVGLGMADCPGTASRLFQALAGKRINILAIAQGSSELSISFAIERREARAALSAIHEEFGLHRLDTGVDSARRLDLILFGCGQIGRRLCQLVAGEGARAFERFGLEAQVVALCDRGGYVFAPAGLSEERLAALLAGKAGGAALTELGGRAIAAPRAMIDEVLSYRLSRPVLIDVSDADSSALLQEALGRGCDVVTANKKPLAGAYADFRALSDGAERCGQLLRAEATVGAGLPVLDTLAMLMATGDRLLRAEGCLSGTLGFIMTRLEDGAPLSQAVIEAREAGYTEPDPVADLSGADVARKALILARISGLIADDRGVELEGLVAPELSGLAFDELIACLERDYDAPLAERVAAARREGGALRYVARVEDGRAVVGPATVPRSSPMGMLRGSDNMIVFTTEFYRAQPLIVIGPGAGIDVTAMGVLGDVLRIAAERR